MHKHCKNTSNADISVLVYTAWNKHIQGLIYNLTLQDMVFHFVEMSQYCKESVVTKAIAESTIGQVWPDYYFSR